MKILKGGCHKEGERKFFMKDYEIVESTPLLDGYYMPAEFSMHRACILIWPERPGSWPDDAKAARVAFYSVIKTIAGSEKVYLAAGKKGITSALEMLFGGFGYHMTSSGSYVLDKKEGFPAKSDRVDSWRCNIEIFPAETDDAWARDIAPTFLLRRDEGGGFCPAKREGKGHFDIRAVNWEFNAWGGCVDGLYASWEKDNAFASFFAKKIGISYYNASPFVLEGGSVHSDGEGTILVTEACLLSAGRNPDMNREQIEEKLKQYLDARKVLWLPHGIYLDETNEHVDNVCAFIRPAEVVLAWTDNKNDPQYAFSAADYEYLSNVTDAKGRKITIHKLQLPEIPICMSKEEISGYSFEEGEEVRRPGERLAASYVNFYFANHAVVMPAFGGENEESDKRAKKLLQRLCPEREIIMIPARDILAGGGNVHCITQQIPK